AAGCLLSDGMAPLCEGRVTGEARVGDGTSAPGGRRRDLLSEGPPLRRREMEPLSEGGVGEAREGDGASSAKEGDGTASPREVLGTVAKETEPPLRRKGAGRASGQRREPRSQGEGNGTSSVRSIICAAGRRH